MSSNPVGYRVYYNPAVGYRIVPYHNPTYRLSIPSWLHLIPNPE